MSHEVRLNKHSWALYMLQYEAEVEYLRAAVSGASTARGDVQESRKEI